MSISPPKKSGWGSVLTAILILAILSTVAALGYVVTNPAEESFTEFYLLGLDGTADNYPGQLRAGEPGKVIVGIINREHETTTYRLQITVDGAVNREITPVTLQHGEKWEEAISFLPGHTGDRQKVEFLLYRQEQTEVYRSLLLWVDVR
ncbi:MAG: DUF1616 domain-containing protein [Chloroflexota bacterium]